MGVGAGRLASGVAPKKCGQTHKCGLTAAMPGCPLHGNGGHKGETCTPRPAETLSLQVENREWQR